MPPHLHPRSTATSTLFAGTLLTSFIVIGIPHIFPCPRPRTGYADAAESQRIQFDEDGRPLKMQRRRYNQTSSTTPETQTETGQISCTNDQDRSPSGLAESKDLEEEAALFRELQREAAALEKEARECPVPKPRGLIGRLLGFEEDKKAVPVVKVGVKS
ncbi:hypothetical protein HRR78_004372 [Exophiala dermatitidis]|nr:hypothetical protein HRR78_004372 [Exophiala dermatitidis]